jgi:hypothetical protein
VSRAMTHFDDVYMQLKVDLWITASSDHPRRRR